MAHDQVSGEPRGVAAQSLARIRAPSSPPPEGKPLAVPANEPGIPLTIGTPDRTGHSVKLQPEAGR